MRALLKLSSSQSDFCSFFEAPVDTHRPREATAVDSAETTIVPACPNFTTGAHAILTHQDILGGWRVGLTNSSPVLNFEEERDRAPD